LIDYLISESQIYLDKLNAKWPSWFWVFSTVFS
jgi:hypothetical protein